MQKEGLIAAYLVLALVLLIVILALLYVWSRVNTPTVQEEYTPVKDCVRESSEQGLVAIGSHGGYASIAHNNVNGTAFGYRNRQNNLPGLNTIKDELETYISQSVPICVSNAGYPVQSATAEVQFNQEDLFVNVGMPLGPASARPVPDQFNVTLPVRLRFIYDRATEAVESAVDGSTDLSLFSWRGLDATVQHFPLGDVVSVQDNQSLVQGKPYVFSFGVDSRG
jgi:hypothetical protein